MKHSLQMVLFTLMFGSTGSVQAFEMMQLASDFPDNFAMERQLIESAKNCTWKSTPTETQMSKASPEMQSFLLAYSDLADKPTSTSKLCVGKVVCPTFSSVSKMDVKFQSASDIVCHFNDAKAECDAKTCFLKTTDYKENMAGRKSKVAEEPLLQHPESDAVDSSSSPGRK